MLIIITIILYLPSLDYLVRLSASCTFSTWQHRQIPCSQGSNTSLERVADLVFSPPYALPFLQHKRQSPKHAYTYTRTRTHTLFPSLPDLKENTNIFKSRSCFNLPHIRWTSRGAIFKAMTRSSSRTLKIHKDEQKKRTQLGQSIPIAVWRCIVQFVQDDNVFRFIEGTSYSGNQSFKDVHYVYRREKKVKQQQPATCSGRSFFQMSKWLPATAAIVRHPHHFNTSSMKRASSSIMIYILCCDC